MRNIISTFNRLTDPELVDSKVFESVLERHYGKFKYFYNMLLSIDELNIIEDMVCAEVDDGLDFIISFPSIKDSKSYKNAFKNNLEDIDDYYRKYFSYMVSSDDTTITIRIICNLESEDKIYKKHYSSI